MKKRTLDKVEFYITNVCNLTCDYCNRYNNFNFKGWQRWQEYAKDYELWGRYLDIKHLVILGGEPLLNPDITKWITGLNKIWGPVQLLTNGTMINRVPNLYHYFKRPHNNWLSISMHNSNSRQQDWLFGEIEKFLQGPVRITQGRNQHASGADWEFEDRNQVKISLWEATEFQSTSLVGLGNGRYTLHQSNAERAHAVCGFALHKNYHFIKGKFYKCGPVALFPEFDQQFDLNLDAADRDLINSYRPLSAQEYPERAQEFFTNLDLALPQCKFCPEAFTVHKIAAITK